MTGRILTAVSGVALTSFATLAQSPPTTLMPNDAVRAILVQRVDQERRGVAIAAGLIEPGQRRQLYYGPRTKGGNEWIDGDTVFEIGSITKVFTSLLLADMVQRGEVALSDPVSKYLPPEVKMPERGGQAITLRHLANHTSGLPRLPANLKPADASNPYADYSVDQLHAFLSSSQLPRDVGAQFEYSNLGGGLLGHVLARRAGMDYESLVRARILTPLKMTSTAIVLPPDLKKRLAAGYNAQLQPVPNWDLPTLAGAGALRSTLHDLTLFLAAAMGAPESPLTAAFASMRTGRVAAGGAGREIGLGWIIQTNASGKQIIWHNGGTGGYRSFIGFDPAARTGVALLSNTSTAIGVDDIGMHLLDPSMPLSKPPAPPKERTPIAVDAKVLEGYVGGYELAPNVIMTVSREGRTLFAQLTGQPRFEIFAEREREFFYKVVDAQLTFETDAQGVATRVILHQNGQRIPGKRLP